MRGHLFVVLASLALVGAGCPGDLQPNSSGGDGSGGFDHGAYQDIGPRPDGYVSPGTDSKVASSDASASFKCSGDCHDFVLDRILLPTSSAQSKAYGYRKAGKIYNAFGDLMVLVGSQVSSLDVQKDVDLSVYEGKTLLLVRVKASSLTSGTARAQAWLGDTMKCCTDTSSVAACKAQAKSKCFSGSTALDVSTKSPKDMVFSGSITGGKFTFGPSKLLLPLDI